MSTRRGAHEGSIFQRKDGRWVGQLDVGYVVTPQGRPASLPHGVRRVAR